MPTAREELASSPSSSEISIAKENRLSGESCSRKGKYSESFYDQNAGKSTGGSWTTYLLQGNLLPLTGRC